MRERNRVHDNSYTADNSEAATWYQGKAGRAVAVHRLNGEETVSRHHLDGAELDRRRLIAGGKQVAGV